MMTMLKGQFSVLGESPLELVVFVVGAWDVWFQALMAVVGGKTWMRQLD
jgi:hypothetical protein